MPTAARAALIVFPMLFLLAVVALAPADIQPAGGGGSGAPTDAQYVTLATDATLSAERVLTAGNGLALTDGGAGSTATLDLGGGSAEVISLQHPGTNITGSGFQTVASFTLPGGSLGTANSLDLQSVLEQTTGTGNATYRVTYGSTVIATMAAASNQQPPFIEIYGDGTTSAQAGFISALRPYTNFAFGAAAEDSTGNLTVLVEMDLATDSDVFVCRTFRAVLYRAP